MFAPVVLSSLHYVLFFHRHSNLTVLLCLSTLACFSFLLLCFSLMLETFVLLCSVCLFKLFWVMQHIGDNYSTFQRARIKVTSIRTKAETESQNWVAEIVFSLGRGRLAGKCFALCV